MRVHGEENINLTLIQILSLVEKKKKNEKREFLEQYKQN